MYPCIFSRTYAGGDVGAVLLSIGADGFRGAQMNLSSFGMESLPETLDEAVLMTGQATARDLGITLAALSGTYNMAHPDEARRHAMRPRFANVLKAAKTIGAPVVSLCTGSRNPANMWAHHPSNDTSEAWSDLRGELDWALDQAAAYDLVLAVEPEPGNIVGDAAVARKLLDEVKSTRLKIILDAANLVGVDGLSRQQAIIAEAVDLLGPDVCLAHVKDIDGGGRVVAPGRGAIDLPLFVQALRRGGFDGALIGHGFEQVDAGVAGKALVELCGQRS